jgi:hypothetical protein
MEREPWMIVAILLQSRMRLPLAASMIARTYMATRLAALRTIKCASSLGSVAVA